MRYVLSKLRFYEEDRIYRVYVTDALKVMSGIKTRYADLAAFKQVKEETRTPDEIINSIRRKLNGPV